MIQDRDSNESAARDLVRMDCLKAVLDFERDLAKRRNAPDVDNLPQSRFRGKLEIIAVVLISLGISGVALLGNFLIFNKVLHWTF